jgi:hypothetical protein
MMKKIAGLLVMASVALALALSLGTSASSKATSLGTSPAVSPATSLAASSLGNAANAAEAAKPDPGAAAKEAHPQIREAIASLRRAKEHMEHAAHDFGGHRVEAIRATDEAIRQLEECLRYDKD